MNQRSMPPQARTLPAGRHPVLEQGFVDGLEERLVAPPLRREHDAGARLVDDPL